MSNVVFPPPGAPVPVQGEGMKIKKDSLVNRYYDPLLDQRGDGQPRPNDVFTEKVEDICFAIGLPTDTVDGNVLVRYLLYHLPTGHPTWLAQALQLAFAPCLSHMKYKKHTVHQARTLYSQHYKYGSLPDEYQATGESLFDAFEASLSTSTYKARQKYGGEANLTSVGEALAAITDFCEITAEEFYDLSRATYKKDVHPASVLLRAALTVRIRREKKDITTFMDGYLSTEDDFAAGAALHEHHNSKVKDTVSTGSYMRPGLKSGIWASVVKDWVKEAEDYARGPDTTEEQIKALVSRPFPHEQHEEVRRRFHEKLKEISTAAGYPCPQYILQAIYRTYDPYAGNTYGRSLVEQEKEAILWHMGKEGYLDSYAGALRITCEDLGLGEGKVTRCLASYNNLDAAIAAVLLKYPDDAPARLDPQQIHAILQEGRNEKKRQRLREAKASGDKKGKRSNGAGDDAGKKKQKRKAK